MIKINGIHHIAIICSNYTVSKKFYTDILGFEINGEYFRENRNSFKLDLKLGEKYWIELFSFPDPPARTSRPEACGLRHLAFEVSDLDDSIAWLNKNGVATERVRVDEYTGKRFTFFADPDNLPLELYEK
jgi:glyoxylase I family protein